MYQPGRNQWSRFGRNSPGRNQWSRFVCRSCVVFGFSNRRSRRARSVVFQAKNPQWGPPRRAEAGRGAQHEALRALAGGAPRCKLSRPRPQPLPGAPEPARRRFASGRTLCAPESRAARGPALQVLEEFHRGALLLTPAPSRSKTPGRGARRHPVTHLCSRAPRSRTVSHVHVSACALHAVTHAVRVHEGKGHQTQGKAAKSSCVLMSQCTQLTPRSLCGCTMQGMPDAA